ncbi:MAG TPA: competence/damage-inducible protein A, partial [Bacillota bacterium]
MKAELVCIGTELLLGETLNTNAQYLGQHLADLGIDVYRRAVVGDNLARAQEAVAQALARADVVLTTGGLGPTMDDVTREVIAAVTGRPLRRDPALAAALASDLEARGLAVTETQLRQALLPEGAEALPNPYGTAPGIWVEVDGRVVCALPGPPAERRPMFTAQVEPRLRRLLPGGAAGLHRRILKVCGLPEAEVEDRLADLIARQSDPTIAPYAKSGEIHLRLATKASDPADAAARFDGLEAEIRRRLGWHLFGRDDDTLPGVVGRLLAARGLTLAAAESCTGGLLGARITDVPGSSAYFLLSVVAYSNHAKQRVLGVPGDLLAAHGAVSEPVALAMAEGARRVAGADVGLGVTGIAGPGGGT